MDIFANPVESCRFAPYYPLIYKTLLIFNLLALMNCTHVSKKNDTISYCVPKENCNDTGSNDDDDIRKCKKSGQNLEFDTCCLNILPQIKCSLWENKKPENTNTINTMNQSKVEKIKSAKIFNQKICGISSATGLSRIAYGKKTQIAEFPWMAMLEYNIFGHKLDNNFLCGGSLISDKIVS